MTVSVLIPTVAGREQVLEETTAGYQETAPGCEILITTGRSWGAGLNELAELATNELLLFAPDDALPGPGWLEAGVEMLERGVIPIARYLNRDGSPLGEQDGAAHGAPFAWTRLFLIPREIFRELGPMIDATWWADVEYSERIVDSGRPMQICGPFAFTHLDGDRSLWLDDVEMERQKTLYDGVRARKMGAVQT